MYDWEDPERKVYSGHTWLYEFLGAEISEMLIREAHTERAKRESSFAQVRERASREQRVKALRWHDYR